MMNRDDSDGKGGIGVGVGVEAAEDSSMTMESWCADNDGAGGEAAGG